jgi:multicomponent Na+:H+ antiporter subunit G
VISAALGTALLAGGFFFVAAGAIGVLRLPDFYTRLHAVGKNDTLGVALMLLGFILIEGLTRNSAKMLLLVLFISLANPVATHALGRAAWRTGLKPWKRNGS